MEEDLEARELDARRDTQTLELSATNLHLVSPLIDAQEKTMKGILSTEEGVPMVQETVTMARTESLAATGTGTRIHQIRATEFRIPTQTALRIQITTQYLALETRTRARKIGGHFVIQSATSVTTMSDAACALLIAQT